MAHRTARRGKARVGTGFGAWNIGVDGGARQEVFGGEEVGLVTLGWPRRGQDPRRGPGVA